MAAEKPSTLLYRFASRWDDLERIKKQHSEALTKLREVTDAILEDQELLKVLQETGVRVDYNRTVRYNESLKNTSEPLEVVEPTVIPFAHEVDGDEPPAPERPVGPSSMGGEEASTNEF